MLALWFSALSSSLFKRFFFEIGVAKQVALIVASVKKKKKEIIGEAADTLYHMLVLLRSKNISINEVMTELASREGISGIEEKRKRNLK